MHNVTISLVGHSLMNVLSIVEFSFRSNGCPWRSTCMFRAYIQGRLTKFFEGSILSKVGNLLNIFVNSY